MSLIVEDGSIVAGAESYVSVATADSYHARSARAAEWAAKSEGQKEALLVQGQRILDSMVTWTGVKASGNQALQWPRAGVPYQDTLDISFGTPVANSFGYYPENKIPPEVQQAQMELAMLQMDGDRAAPSSSAGIKSVGVGDGAVEVEFDTTRPPPVIPSTITNMVRMFTQSVAGSGFGMVKVFRT